MEEKYTHEESFGNRKVIWSERKATKPVISTVHEEFHAVLQEQIAQGSPKRFAYHFLASKAPQFENLACDFT